MLNAQIAGGLGAKKAPAAAVASKRDDADADGWGDDDMPPAAAKK
jgi:hypothetical protein